MKATDAILIIGGAFVAYKVYSEVKKVGGSLSDALNPANWARGFKDAFNFNFDTSGLKFDLSDVFKPAPLPETGISTSNILLNTYVSTIPMLNSVGLLNEQFNYDTQRNLLGPAINKWEWGPNVREW